MENQKQYYKDYKRRVKIKRTKTYNKDLNIIMALVFITFIAVVIVFNVFKKDIL